MIERKMEEMIRRRRPVAVAPDTPASEADRVMREKRIGAVLVTEGGKLCGIFTGRDALQMLADGRSGDVPLREVMTTDVWTMTTGQTATEALRLMQDGGFRHVPVVNGGELVGIVSWGDFRDAEHDRIDTEIALWERI